MLQAGGSARGPWGWRRLDGIETPRPSGFVGPSSHSWGLAHPVLQSTDICCPSQVAPPSNFGVWTSSETYSAHQNPREVDWPEA